MCFLWIWEQTAIISLYSINWSVFITVTECVYYTVRTASSYKTHYVSPLKVLSNTECLICKSDLNMSVRLYIYQACDTNGNIYGTKTTLPTNTVHSRQCRARTLAGYCKIISLLARMAGKVQFTPKRPAAHLPNYSSGKSGHSAVHVKPHHACVMTDSRCPLLPHRVELRTAVFDNNYVHTTDRCISSYNKPWQWRHKESLKHWIPTPFLHIRSHREPSVALSDTKISLGEWNNTKWLPHWKQQIISLTRYINLTTFRHSNQYRQVLVQGWCWHCQTRQRRVWPLRILLATSENTFNLIFNVTYSTQYDMFLIMKPTICTCKVYGYSRLA
jgi:hypothetical protein